MPHEKKEGSTVDFLNEIGREEPFKEETEDTAQEEIVEKEEDSQALPFHKDPKVQRYVERQIEKAIKDSKPSAEQQFRQEVKEELNLPSSFITLVGNDTPEKQQVLKDLANYFGTLKGEAKKEFVAEMQEQERQAIERDNKALQELNAGFEEIEETHNVDLSSNTTSAQRTRTAFVEYLRKVSHKNADGEVDQFADIPAAWEEFQTRNKAQPTRAKELASRGLTRSTDASTAVPAGRSWKDVEKFFNKLKE